MVGWRGADGIWNMEDVRTCGQGPRLPFTVYGCGWRDGAEAFRWKMEYVWLARWSRGIPMEDVGLAAQQNFF